MDLRRK